MTEDRGATTVTEPAAGDPLHLTAGSTAGDGYLLVITPTRAGWTYSGLRVLELAAGGSFTVTTGDEEMLLLPLAGAAEARCDGTTVSLHGRSTVFGEVTDFAYLPRDAEVVVTSAGGGRFALPSTRCERRLPFRYGSAADVPVELRGAGPCSRQVTNYCLADTFDADKLIVCEVLTPGGNWSSYPPHKHDEASETESQLEEIYYFEVAGHDSASGIGYQRVYGTAGRPIDVLAEVRSGDVVLVPHGWHGPSMAAPGYDLYYLNVMGGPERAWRICDDPAHAWVRETWSTRAVDPRLPMRPPTG